ncbi:hypothetical protein QUF80_09980 [Desulfococcaceae bacterium HSG8]|nr:hypothetical protein [Desulfococcaceae bacterium HSG8]
MMEEKKITLKQSLESNEDFLSFLEQEARSDDYQRLKEKTAGGHHPAEDMLNDYVSDCLSDEDTRMITDHILLCRGCSKKVLQFRRIQGEAEEDLEKWADEPVTFSEKLKCFVSNLMSGYRARLAVPPVRSVMVGFSMAAACLIIYLLTPQTPEMSGLIAGSYQAALVQKMTFSQRELKEDFSFPWEISDQSFEIASPAQYFPYSRAFGAGLWSGRQMLGLHVSETNDSQEQVSELPVPDFLSPRWKGDSTVTADEWSETSWDIYFFMGQWCFLARAVCLSDAEVPDAFWERQGLILEKIQKKFTERSHLIKKDPGIVTASLGRVRSVLKDPGGGLLSEKQCKTVDFELDNLITYLSPRYQP